MSLTTSVIPGTTWVRGDKAALAKLNSTATPVVNISGTMGTEEIEGYSITAAKVKSDAYAWASGCTFGSPNYALAFPNNSFADDGGGDPPDGTLIAFRADATCAASPTLSFTGTGHWTDATYPLLSAANGALWAGAISANQIVTARFNGTSFQVTSPVNPRPAAAVGNVRNLRIYRTTPTTSLEITADIANLWDASGALHPVAVGTLNVAIGTDGLGGMVYTSSKATGWWYLWLVSNGATVNAIAATSGTEAVLALANYPAGYTFKTLIGMAYYDGSIWFDFFARGNQYAVTPTKVNASGLADTGGSATALSGADATSFRSLVAPIASAVQCSVQVIDGGGTNTVVEVSSTKATGATNATAHGAQRLYCTGEGTANTAWIGGCAMHVPLNTDASGSHNLQYVMSQTGAGNTANIYVSGFTL